MAAVELTCKAIEVGEVDGKQSGPLGELLLQMICPFGELKLTGPF